MADRIYLLAVENDENRFVEQQPVWQKHCVEAVRVHTMQEAIELLTTAKNEFAIVGINADSIVFLPMLPLLRDVTPSPIHILTSAYSIEESLESLRLGADHYGEWWHNPEESTLRGMAMLQRYIDRSNRNKLPLKYYSHKNIFVCLTNRKVYVDSIETARLTGKEFKLLCLLISDSDRVYTHRQIFRQVWGDEYVDCDNGMIWSMVKRIRKKLKVSDGIPDYIINIKDVGYVFDPS